MSLRRPPDRPLPRPRPAARSSDGPPAASTRLPHESLHRAGGLLPQGRRAAAADLCYLFDGTFGNINRTATHLAAFHLNFYNQNIFAASEAISVVSVNGGLSLIVRGFVLSGYLGVYKLEFLDTCQLSFDLSAQVFLPARLYLDIYNYSGPCLRIRFWL